MAEYTSENDLFDLIVQVLPGLFFVLFAVIASR
jgi:hypothetical protein